MGISTKSIPFFTDDMELDVHTATHFYHLWHTDLRSFADGTRMKLEQVQETGEYIATRADGAFIWGQEI